MELKICSYFDGLPGVPEVVVVVVANLVVNDADGRIQVEKKTVKLMNVLNSGLSERLN